MCTKNPLQGLETSRILLGSIKLSENHLIHLPVSQLVFLHFTKLLDQHLQFDRKQVFSARASAWAVGQIVKAAKECSRFGSDTCSQVYIYGGLNSLPTILKRALAYHVFAVASYWLP